jgi:nitroreductase
VSWRFGRLTDRAGHVHLGAVVAGSAHRARAYIELLAPLGAARPGELDLEHLVVLVHGEDVADLQRLVERCIDDDRLRRRLVERCIDDDRLRRRLAELIERAARRRGGWHERPEHDRRATRDGGTRGTPAAGALPGPPGAVARRRPLGWRRRGRRGQSRAGL